ncbi:Qat anti-phage system associated protein QatB [Methylobacterium sp. D48H]
MGTSTPYRGGRNANPLLPSWLPGGDDAPPGAPPADPGDPPAPPEAPPGASDPADGAPDPGGNPADPVAPVAPAGPQPGAPQPPRYQAARRSFNVYAKSGGGDGRALGRAARGFVRRAGGGVGRTARRMASERAATARLAGVLARASTDPGGIREIARQLDLGALADGPIEDLYAGLVDIVCPPDGDLDDAHSREAYLEAVIEVMGRGFGDLERPGIETIRAVLGLYITNAVHLRIVNAIANDLVTLPRDIDEVAALQEGLKDFVRGCVEQALAEAGDAFPADDLTASIDEFYEQAIGILDAEGDAAAEGEGRIEGEDE